MTEFLPISSTGHLLVAAHLLDANTLLEGPFIIAIQFGAVLALLHYHAPEIAQLFRWRAEVQHFWWTVLLAFLPTAIAGITVGSAIERVFLESENSIIIVAIALVIGGLLLWLVERRSPQPSPGSSDHLPQLTFIEAFVVGLFQLTAFIPGVSRAAASIVGGLLCGLDRKKATRFSFFLAIPTLGAASTYSTLLYVDQMTPQIGVYFLLGTFVSALVAGISIRWLFRYLDRNRFTVFAFYRLLAGLAIIGFRLAGWV